VFNQVAFNFAVFYPVGLLAGYGDDPRGQLPVYLAAWTFNIATYLFAFLSGVDIGQPLLAAVDFLSMSAVVWMGIFFGRRLRAEPSGD